MSILNQLVVIVCMLLILKSNAQVTCNPDGNMLIMANYDGGILNINIDQNIPNLKIGVLSYEPVIVNLTGIYAANVSQLIRAGFPNTDNNNCNLGIIETVINGPNPSNYSIINFPSATLSNPNGNSSIICAYSCDNNSNQGGCNTIDQAIDYFSTTLSGTLLGLKVQYCCWQNTDVYSVSSLANQCCNSSVGSASISYPNAIYCSSLTNTPAATIVGEQGGSFSASSGLEIDPITGIINPANSIEGQYTVNYSIAGCPGFTTSTNIEIGSTTEAPTGTTPQLVCNGALINQLNVQGNAIQWYDSPSGGVLLPMNTLLIDNTNYFASQTLNNCESSDRLSVLVQFTNSETISVSSSGSLTICQGETVTLIAEDGLNNYIWNTNTQGNSLLVSTAGSYSVNAIDVNGCILQSAPIIVSNSIPFTIDVQPISPITICEGENIVLTAENGFSQYVWSNGLTGSSVTINSAGIYSVSASNIDGCFGTSEIIEVNNNPPPSANFTYVPGTELYEILFSSENLPGINYQWTFENGTTSNDPNPTHVFPFDATWPTTLIASNACGADTFSMGIVVLKSSITELNGINKLVISPNPGSELLKIHGTSQFSQNISTNIYTVDGKLTHSKSQVINGIFIIEVNTIELSSGTYNIVIDNGKQKRNFQWIKL